MDGRGNHVWEREMRHYAVLRIRFAEVGETPLLHTKKHPPLAPEHQNDFAIRRSR